jgi:DNA-directed RNA polymerase specialized sigma24 family protein
MQPATSTPSGGRGTAGMSSGGRCSLICAQLHVPTTGEDGDDRQPASLVNRLAAIASDRGCQTVAWISSLAPPPIRRLPSTTAAAGRAARTRWPERASSCCTPRASPAEPVRWSTPASPTSWPHTASTWMARGSSRSCMVALRDSLSNMNPPLVRLLEAVEDGLVVADDHAVALGEDACVVREMAENRILAADEVAELVEAYGRGAAVLELARRFGVHRHTVDRHLQRAGIAKRPMIKIDPELLAEAIELYEQGLSAAKVGKKLGLSASTVYSTFAREGVRMRPPRRPPTSKER